MSNVKERITFKRYSNGNGNADIHRDNEIVGKINAFTFAGYRPGTVLCTSSLYRIGKRPEFSFTVLNADDIIALKGNPVKRVYDSVDFNAVVSA